MAKIDCNVDFGNVGDFTDISSEQWREYVFPQGETVRIDAPQWLNVSKSGGHRLIDLNGISHYIPPKWLHLYWQVFKDQFYFAK